MSLLEAETEFGHPQDLLFDLPDLDDKLVCLERKISSLQIEPSPHKKLPPELMAEIFLFSSIPTVALPPKTDEPLLILTQICRTWRELALHVPELWASISVSFTEEHDNVERVTQISREWLSRAGNTYPLSITAECTGAYATTACENPELVAAFMSMVVSRVHHLQHFELAFPIAALLPLFELPRGAFLCLETMSLRPLLLLRDMAAPETGFTGWHWPSTAVAFESAPLVREVTFSPLPLFKLAELENITEDIMETALATPETIINHPFFAPTFALPWSQLSVISFSFTALTADVWCSVLAQCPKIVHLEVAIMPSPSVECDFTVEQHIHLDSLTYLSVSAFSGGGEALIDRLFTPRLNLFVLMGSQIKISSITNFQARSAFVLKTFIPVIPIPAEDVEGLFQHLSDITTLSILAISTEHFPASFWECVGRADLLPQLDTLLVRPTAAQVPVLVDMIATRWEAAVAGYLPGLAVGFCDVRSIHLSAIKEELRRLEQYEEGRRSVEMLTPFTSGKTAEVHVRPPQISDIFSIHYGDRSDITGNHVKVERHHKYSFCTVTEIFISEMRFTEISAERASYTKGDRLLLDSVARLENRYFNIPRNQKETDTKRSDLLTAANKEVYAEGTTLTLLGVGDRPLW
ncbi:hypothetical protein B0H19DRAFT_1059876 [Mycena capillaripes]|nr:hypothetical protein B0H19DRAFT_1059876 [Mycena capillaripes]